MYHTKHFNVYPTGGAGFGRKKQRQNGGFTLIELAIVLIIVGLLVGVGVGSWVGMMEGRKIAATVSSMAQVKNCLVQKIYSSEQYPRYSSTSLSCSGAVDPSYAVDDCLCSENVRDAWGNELLYLDGVSAAGNGFGDPTQPGSFLLSDTARGQTLTSPGSSSRVTDHTGTTRDDVAFVLISRGDDGVLCDGTCNYDTLFTNRNVNTVPVVTADFQNNGDDVYLVVHSRDLAAAIRQ